jgi:predicted esterase
MTSFLDGVGSADISGRVKKKAAECPNMKFAVIGYSQGGMIAASGLAAIPKNLQEKVIAVVLYAPFGGASPPAAFQNRYLQHCASGDPVSLSPLSNERMFH